MISLHFAKMIVLDEQNNALLLRRSGTHPRRPYMPDLPGGLIEKGETVIEGLIRELREETGIIVEPAEIIDPHENFKQHFGLKLVEHIIYVTYIKGVKPPIEISWEHDQYSWIHVNDIKNLELPIQRAVDDILKNGLWKKVTPS